MKRRSIVALLLAAVLAAAVAATTSGATKKANANTLTVWLQTDAQSGWPDVVAAANQQFQSDHPGWTVNVQYQSWSDHLQKLDTVLAAAAERQPDVVEMGNTETTKYMAAGAFANLRSLQGQLRELGELAQRSRQVGHVRRQALRRPVLRRLARRHVPHRPLEEGRDPKLPNSTAASRPTRRSCRRRTRRRASRRSTSPGPTGTSRWASSSTTAGGIAQQVSGKWDGLPRLAEVDRRSRRVQGLL